MLQQQNCLVFIYGTLIGNHTCVARKEIKKEEVIIAKSDINNYKKKLQQEVYNRYNSTTGYQNAYGEVVQANEVALVYTASSQEKIIGKNGETCETTYFLFVTATTFEYAKQKFAAIQKDRPNDVFTPYFQWGNIPIQKK